MPPATPGRDALRVELRALGLSVKGTKAELVARFEAHLDSLAKNLRQKQARSRSRSPARRNRPTPRVRAVAPAAAPAAADGPRGLLWAGVYAAAFVAVPFLCLVREHAAAHGFGWYGAAPALGHSAGSDDSAAHPIAIARAGCTRRSRSSRPSTS